MSTSLLDDTTWKNLTTIAAVEVSRAYLHPGRAFGTSLQPFVRTTVTMEPSQRFVFSRPAAGEIWSGSNQAVVIPSLCLAWREELEALHDSDRNRFNQAVTLINGEALRSAEAFMRSPS